MRKHLYFICPTDHLENIIQKNLSKDNYFITSLGNSISFGPDLIEEINSLIRSRNIEEITFVLSDNNKFFKDALENQRFNNIRSLKQFYNFILNEKIRSNKIWEKSDIRSLIIAYYLNLKSKELELLISDPLFNPINLSAKIYKRQKNIFNEVHADLFSLDSFSLN